MDDPGKKTLKGNRFLLLSNYDTLSPEKQIRLDALLEANQPLFPAHSMKEQLRLFWDEPDRHSAGKFLDVWCGDAMQSGLQALAGVAETLAGYKTGLLNYFVHRITSSAVEEPTTRSKPSNGRPMDSGI